jgi:integrase
VEGTTAYRAWVRIGERLAEKNIRALTMHSLRHTFATLSLESGKSVKWVSQQLGHRSATLTLDTYAHALPDEEADLSYLPNLGPGANRRSAGASRKLKSVETRVSN